MPGYFIRLILFCAVWLSAAPANTSLPFKEIFSSGSKGGCVLTLEMHPGEPDFANDFVVRCRVTLPADAQLKELTFSQDALKNLVQTDSKELPPQILKERGSIITRDYILDATLPEKESKFILPSIKATIQLIDGKSVILESDEYEIALTVPTKEELEGLAINSSQEAATSLTTPYERRRELFMLWGIIVGAVIVLTLIICYLRHRQQRKRDSLPPPSPYEIAMERLDELLKKALPDAGEYKQYYTGISGILREYIEGRYSINAPTQTTEEFLRSLTGKQIPQLKEFRSILQNFLTECDMVKFAEQHPTTEQSDHLAQTCREFLDTTRPKESTPTEQCKA